MKTGNKRRSNDKEFDKDNSFQGCSIRKQPEQVCFLCTAVR